MVQNWITTSLYQLSISILRRDLSLFNSLCPTHTDAGTKRENIYVKNNNNKKKKQPLFLLFASLDCLLLVLLVCGNKRQKMAIRSLSNLCSLNIGVLLSGSARNVSEFYSLLKTETHTCTENVWDPYSVTPLMPALKLVSSTYINIRRILHICIEYKPSCYIFTVTVCYCLLCSEIVVMYTAYVT